MPIEEIAGRIQKVADQIETVIVGKRQAIEMSLVALLVGGHLLIEDIPGVGKTTLGKTLALSLGCAFKRIQFTPDLLPADITGTSLFNQKTQEFEYRPGPVFANVVLADEINRTTARTQAALLECMEERQITSDGVTHILPRPFFVIATQNNVEYAGTYPLPEAQLDRFLIRLRLGYPSIADEVNILSAQMQEHPLGKITPILQADELVEIQDMVRKVYVDPKVQRYIVDIVDSTRPENATDDHPVWLGVSPRGSLSLMHAAQAYAAMQGRSQVFPDDVKRLAPHVLAHRISLNPSVKNSGRKDTDVIVDLMNRIPVPVGIGR